MFRLFLFLMAAVVTVVTFYVTSRDAWAVDSCVRLVRTPGSEALVNSCGTCVMVGVTRERPGYGRPQNRKFHVQARSRFPLPFRGPGRTRIGSKQACDTANLGDPERFAKKLEDHSRECVKMEQDAASRRIFVSNSCNVCRMASVYRFDSRRRNMGQQVMVVAPKQSLAIQPYGAAQVALSGEQPCPANISR